MKIVCNIGGTVKVTAKSGTEYVFTDNNKIIEMNGEDAQDLLSKKIKYKPCCNGTQTVTHYFSKVE